MTPLSQGATKPGTSFAPSHAEGHDEFLQAKHNISRSSCSCQTREVSLLRMISGIIATFSCNVRHNGEGVQVLTLAKRENIQKI